MTAAPTRRAVLTAGLAAGAVSLVGAAADLRGEWLRRAAGRPGLAGIAARAGLLFGTAVQAPEIAGDAAYRAVLEREVQIITAENELKWGVVSPTPETFDFSRADPVFAYTQAQGMAMRGHNFVWHIGLPDWFASTVTRANIRAVLARRINVPCRRYAGRLHSWDVVNEAIEVKDGRADGLRDTPFLRLMGPDYLDFAFTAAAAADPSTPLVLNEMGVEMDDDYCAARRQALLALLRRLLANRIPVHALGIESHLVAGDSPFDPGLFRRFLGQVAELGLDIYLTEMDVADYRIGPDQTIRDRVVADLYGRYLIAALAEPAVKSIQTWGLTDRYGWLSTDEWTRRRDGLTVRGCPYDDALRPKPARDAIAGALAGAPSRRPG